MTFSLHFPPFTLKSLHSCESLPHHFTVSASPWVISPSHLTENQNFPQLYLGKRRTFAIAPAQRQVSLLACPSQRPVLTGTRPSQPANRPCHQLAAWRQPPAGGRWKQLIPPTPAALQPRLTGQPPSLGSFLFSKLPFQEVFASQLRFETEIPRLCLSSRTQSQSGGAPLGCSCPRRQLLQWGAAQGHPGTSLCHSWVTKLRQQKELPNRKGERLSPPRHCAPPRTPPDDGTHSLPTGVTSGLKPSCPNTQLELLSTLPQWLWLEFSRSTISGFTSVSHLYLDSKWDYNLLRHFSICQPAVSCLQTHPVCLHIENLSLKTAQRSHLFVPRSTGPHLESVSLSSEPQHQQSVRSKHDAVGSSTLGHGRLVL